MQTKLTLSIDKEIVEAAHFLSRRNGKSISKMFEIFIRHQKSVLKDFKGSTLSDLKGRYYGSGIKDKKELRKEMWNRYV